LTEAFLALPFEILIPDLMLSDELLSFPEQEKKKMQALGLTPVELDGASVRKAGQLRQQMPALTVYDCFAYVLAQNTPNSILFTGDQKLRTHAENNQVEVHGLLWGVAQMHQHSVTATKLLILGLQTLDKDPSVRVPRTELHRLLNRLTTSISTS
jgi:hypothetical protein